MAIIKPSDTCIDTGQADPRPGYYYCTVIDGSNYALLAGPYESHQEAIDNLPTVKRVALKTDARAAFYAFGTARLELDETRIRPAGVLNEKAGLLA